MFELQAIYGGVRLGDNFLVQNMINIFNKFNNFPTKRQCEIVNLIHQDMIRPKRDAKNQKYIVRMHGPKTLER